jgi:DNA polymerase I
MSENNSIFLVDGSSLAFRSFFALITSGLRRSDGQPTWAVIGFFNSLFELIEKRNPHCMAISFDLAEPTFRHEEFTEYKANRSEMPDDLKVQWPIIKEGVKKLGIPIYEIAGYEADDVICTVAKVAEHKDMQVVILTGDQDTFQLLDEKIQVLMPTTKEGLKTFGRQEVFEKLGVWPEQVIDYKGLVGDTSDNIPGVRGIGPKTAVQLLTDYKTMEGIYENLGNIKSASVKKKLEEGRDSAFASKNLATIRLDVPVSFDFDHCRLSLPDIEEVATYFRTVESSAILRRLPRILKAFNNGVEPEIDPALLEPIGKASARGKMSFGKGGGGGGTAVVTAERAAEPITAGGGVAVAEQQRLDLVMPAKQIKVGPISEPEPLIVRTPDQLRELVATLSAQQVFALEILTDSHESCEGCVVGYAFAYDRSATMNEMLRPEIAIKEANVRTAYVPVRHAMDAEQLPADDVAAALKPILENEKIGKIAYNAKTELNALSLGGIDCVPVAFDPMLASYVMNPDQSHRLKDQAARALEYNMPAAADLIGTGKKQVTWNHLPVSGAARYAVDAARMSFLLAGWYVQQMDPEQQELLWEMDLPLCKVLAKVEQTGVKIDVPYFNKYAAELSAELKRLEGEIFELAGHEFNINSPLQLQKVLFQELKLPTKKKTESGYSTDASVLEALASEHAIVQKILEYRQISKLNSTYCESLPQQVSSRDGRVHCDFNQTSTATGRLSSTNPNLQNIPIKTEMGRRIREGFVPSSPDHVLISADYSQIELRLLAHMSGDEKLIEAFRADQDIHTRTAMDIFHVSAEEVTAEHRRVGKTLNFALIYQQGAMATANQMNVSTKQAQEYIAKYFASYPKVRSFMEQTKMFAHTNSYVQTLWGRRRYFKNLKDRNDAVRKADERAACNAPLQGSAADLIKLAMIRLDKELTGRGLNGKLILQVHDELVLDVPKGELEETKQVVRESMQMDQPLLVPLRVDIGVGPNWMDAK